MLNRYEEELSGSTRWKFPFAIQRITHTPARSSSYARADKILRTSTETAKII